jgi:hypothetical protein
MSCNELGNKSAIALADALPLSIGSRKQARHQTLRPLITQGLPDVCCTLSIGNTRQPGSEKSSDIRPRTSDYPNDVLLPRRSSLPCWSFLPCYFRQQQHKPQDDDDGNQVEAKHETAELLLMLKEKMEIVSFVGMNGIGGSDSATTSSTKHWLRQQQKMFRKNKIAMLSLKNSKDGK